jgi:hypothetical protein
MSETHNNPYSTLEGLKQHPLWRQLTDKQQVFVEQYIRTKDRFAAVRTAFDVGEVGADGFSARLLQHRQIRPLIAAHFGYKTDKDGALTKNDLADLISKRLRSGTLSDGYFRELTVWYIRLRGWDDATHNKSGKGAIKDAFDKRTEQVITDVDEMVRLLEKGNTE